MLVRFCFAPQVPVSREIRNLGTGTHLDGYRVSIRHLPGKREPCFDDATLMATMFTELVATLLALFWIGVISVIEILPP